MCCNPGHTTVAEGLDRESSKCRPLGVLKIARTTSVPCDPALCCKIWMLGRRSGSGISLPDHISGFPYSNLGRQRNSDTTDHSPLISPHRRPLGQGIWRIRPVIHSCVANLASTIYIIHSNQHHCRDNNVISWPVQFVEAPRSDLGCLCCNRYPALYH